MAGGCGTGATGFEGMEECMGVNEGIEEEKGNPVLKGDEEEEADVDVSRQEPNGGRGPCDRVNTQGVGPACQRMFSRGST